MGGPAGQGGVGVPGWGSLGVVRVAQLHPTVTAACQPLRAAWAVAPDFRLSPRLCL